mgnify:CR=1 FL=1
MIILGIDPGYGTIGYGVIEKLNGKIRAIDYGVITTPKDKPISERLEMIYDAMNHEYISFGEKVGKAFSDGKKIEN